MASREGVTRIGAVKVIIAYNRLTGNSRNQQEASLSDRLLPSLLEKQMRANIKDFSKLQHGLLLHISRFFIMAAPASAIRARRYVSLS